MTSALSHVFSQICHLQQPDYRTRHKGFELRKTRCRRSLPYSLIELIIIWFNTHTHTYVIYLAMSDRSPQENFTFLTLVLKVVNLTASLVHGA